MTEASAPPTRPSGPPQGRGHGHGGRGMRGGVRLTEGPVPRQIFNLTRFLLLGTIATMSFQLADAYFVAQLGTQELAALAFTFPLVMILHAVALGLGTGVTSVVSRAVGNGDAALARVLTTDSILLAFVVALGFAVAGLVFGDFVYGVMGAKDPVLAHLKSYMHVWFFGMPVMVVPLIANAVIRAFGDTKFPSFIVGGAAVFNIFLDPILIFGWGPVPGLGLAGAAYALLMSRLITFALSLIVLQFRVHGLDLSPPSWGRLKDSWAKLLHIALPSTATQLIQPVSSGVLTTLVASYGATAVAAYGISTRVEMFSLIFVMSMSIAMGPFVGQNAGARRIDRVKIALGFAYKAVFIYAVCIAVLLMLFGGAVVAVFSDDAVVIGLAAFYLSVVPFTYGFLGIINISSGTLNSLAKPMPAMMIGVSKSLLVQIPCAYIGSQLYGIKGVFLGMGTSSMIVACLAFVLARREVLGELRAMAVSASSAPAPSAAE